MKQALIRQETEGILDQTMSEKAYEANLVYELKAPSAKTRKQTIMNNSALLKQWAKEGK